MANNEVELKACPFCGGRAYIAETMNDFHIDCEHTANCIGHCSTWLTHGSQSLDEQIRKWNARDEKIIEEDKLNWVQRAVVGRPKRGGRRRSGAIND